MAVGQIELALGARAPDFKLPATDGRSYALKDVAGEKGAVVVFICNHCPYVKAVIGRLVADARTLMAEGVGFAAISSNDAASYPEDSFPKMREFARAHDFPFPYLHDETQDVARAYGAVCTPDFFGFDRGLKLKYRGRLDEGRTTAPPPNARRELLEAMRAHCRRRGGAGEPSPLDRLLDQVEGGAGVMLQPHIRSALMAANPCPNKGLRQDADGGLFL
jgi:peroxiredoxin